MVRDPFVVDSSGDYAAGNLRLSLRALESMRVFVAVVALAAAVTASASPAAAADTSPPQLVDVQLSTDVTTVSGFARTTVQLRLHLTDDTGITKVSGSANGMPDYPFVVLTRTTAGHGQVARLASSEFSLTSGTAQDGWWSTPLRLTAGYDGTWTVTEVGAIDGANTMDVDPRRQGIMRTLRVIGEHVPHLSIRQTPDPVLGGSADITYYGHVTDLDTGSPLRATEHMGFESECTDFPYGGSRSVTPAGDGSWRLAFDHWAPNFGCASIYNFLRVADPDSPGATMTVQVFYAYFFVAPHYRWPVSASLAATSIRSGESTTVYGSTGAVGETVQLQRFVSNSWRTVGSAPVRRSGRFSLVANPPSRGNHRYRVLLLPTIRGEQASSSRVLLLAVT
jgi:hypothetical protein